jgi:hypothetical protein
VGVNAVSGCEIRRDQGPGCRSSGEWDPAYFKAIGPLGPGPSRDAVWG